MSGNLILKSDWMFYGECACGVLHHAHFDSTHFCEPICFRCGAAQNTFKLIKARKVFDGKWYKPWTWTYHHWEYQR